MNLVQPLLSLYKLNKKVRVEYQVKRIKRVVSHTLRLRRSFLEKCGKYI